MTIDEMIELINITTCMSEGEREAIASKLREQEARILDLQDENESIIKLSDSQQVDILQMEATLQTADELAKHALAYRAGDLHPAILESTIAKYRAEREGK